METTATKEPTTHDSSAKAVANTQMGPANPPPSTQVCGALDHAALRAAVSEYLNVERVYLSIDKQVGAFTRTGWPEIALAWSTKAMDDLKPIRSALGRKVQKQFVGPVADWVEDTKGLGKLGVGLLLGSMPPVETSAATPSCLWKWCGLHVENGEAVRLKAGKGAGFAPIRRALALYRVGVPMIQTQGDFVHHFYDRREYTTETHPPMDKANDCKICQEAYAVSKKEREGKHYTRERKVVGRDCANLGGIHWTDGHRYKDALRYMTKEILKELWNVAHGADA